MKRSLALLATVAICLEFSGPVSAAKIGGVGSQTCAKFSDNVSKLVVAPGNITWEDYAYAWAQGWLSRRNVEREAAGRPTVRDLTPEGFGGTDQKAFMRSYCLANPQNTYAKGVDEIYLKLLQMNSLTV